MWKLLVDLRNAPTSFLARLANARVRKIVHRANHSLTENDRNIWPMSLFRDLAVDREMWLRIENSLNIYLKSYCKIKRTAPFSWATVIDKNSTAAGILISEIWGKAPAINLSLPDTCF